MELTDLQCDLSECHCIQTLQNDPEAVHFLQKLRVPIEIISNLYLFTIPSKKDNLYRLHYGYLQEQNPYRELDFSYDDWLLAYLAAENRGWGVISRDYHLTYGIHQYLDYAAFLPEDVHDLPADSMLLLDTNIILHFIEQRQHDQKEIMQMFSLNPSITFLLSENILRELGRVYQKKFRILDRWNKRKSNQRLKMDFQEIQEEEICHFVDNFTRFESGKQRRLRKQHNKQKNYAKYRSKWTRCLN
ncbi:hypothetical protein [Candidatus Lokiarchaeum ossiferum]|uniref:hypothetical protein n=1 Tax=Candidatus Lokiarchaeum ossiferum TaxID=2951803 RepID=UPI00352C8970